MAASCKSSSDASSPSSSQPSSLVFVNVSNPAAIDSQSVRRLVRSSATRHSHRDPTRKPKARKANRSGGASSRKTSPRPSVHSGRSSPEHGVETSSPVLLPGSLFTADDRVKVTNILDQLALESETADMMKVGQTERYAAQPNNAYPVDAEEWFPWVLSYYSSVYLPQGISILQQSAGEGEAFITWFMKEGCSEAALFYMQLLTACTQLVNGDRLPHSHMDWLRTMVVRSINEAIGDPARANSTATLLAVAMIALHERFWGDKRLATEVHGRAFARMIEMRGGIEGIVLPRLAWVYLQWIDVAVSPSIGGATEVMANLMSVWVAERWRPVNNG